MQIRLNKNHIKKMFENRMSKLRILGCPDFSTKLEHFYFITVLASDKNTLNQLFCPVFRQMWFEFKGVWNPDKSGFQTNGDLNLRLSETKTSPLFLH